MLRVVDACIHQGATEIALRIACTANRSESAYQHDDLEPVSDILDLLIMSVLNKGWPPLEGAKNAGSGQNTRVFLQVIGASVHQMQVLERHCRANLL